MIFLFSLFAIFQIRSFLVGATWYDLGNLKLLFFSSDMIKYEDFVLFKMTLFFITASLSFILMVVNFFMYNNERFESRVAVGVKKEILKEIKKRK